MFGALNESGTTYMGMKLKPLIPEAIEVSEVSHKQQNRKCTGFFLLLMILEFHTRAPFCLIEMKRYQQNHCS
jgi:hypothetical protein